LPNTITTLIFIFALGSCIGSFLNVVVWRLPRVELPVKGGLLRDFFTSFKALSNPPSHCPSCNNLLKWYDNIPIFGWLKLGGRCRFCKCRISIRYPIVELLTALIFAGYFLAFYHYQLRTCCPMPSVIGYTADAMGITHEVTNPLWILHDSWPIYALYMFMLSGLLAASLIDAELYIIPLEIPWLLAIVAFGAHAYADRPTIPGSLNLLGNTGPPAAALAAGGTLGLLISMFLWSFGWIPTSFPNGEPMLEVDRQHLQKEMERARKAGELWKEGLLPPPYTPKQIRAEISKEMLFLLPPMLLGGGCVAITVWVPSLRNHWFDILANYNWLDALLGSLLGALVGAFVVWITRILGTLVFRKVAMGLGDVHLMFGIGAVIGAAGATIAFFIAPFFGIVYASYMLIARRGREIPLGPFLSLATAVVLLFYCPVIAYLTPGFQGLGYMLSELVHGGAR
jgi:leader peptidase (prepilin peptidase)/N-methyltransferase